MNASGDALARGANTAINSYSGDEAISLFVPAINPRRKRWRSPLGWPLAGALVGAIVDISDTGSTGVVVGNGANIAFHRQYHDAGR